MNLKEYQVFETYSGVALSDILFNKEDAIRIYKQYDDVIREKHLEKMKIEIKVTQSEFYDIDDFKELV